MSLTASIKPALTQARLKQLLRYDPATGDFFRRVQQGRTLQGTRAGYINPVGYLRIMIDWKLYYAHRLAWLYVHGHFPPGGLDHINRKKADCRIANLRPSAQTQNLANAKNWPSRSGLKGAHWAKHCQKWTSVVQRDGKRFRLGYFDTAQEAHEAYCQAAKKIHGEFFNSGKEP